MPPEFAPQALSGVGPIRPRVFDGEHGDFFESCRRFDFAAAETSGELVQDAHSVSSPGVGLGTHHPFPPRVQVEPVFVPCGSPFDVGVDLRRGSESFGRWLAVTLSEENRHLRRIPPGLGHGFVVLSESARLLDRCAEAYAPGAEPVVRRDDPDLAIDSRLPDVAVPEKAASLSLPAEASVFEASSP